ncbi:MAG: right-handed parallel beta-helix repeat-containing protein [Armatimonadia bacterium]
MYQSGHRNAPTAVAVAIDTHSLNRSLHTSSVLWMLLLLLAASFFAFALPAHSATYFVATNGSDDAAGTSSTPWRNINHAVPLLQSGDVLIIRDGTYNEYVDLDLLAKASPAITIQAENPRKAIINSGNDNSIGIGAWQPVQGVRLVGLKVISGKMGICFYRGGDGMDVINCEVSGGIEGIRIPDGSNLKIQDCYVHDNNQGVLLGVKDSSGVSNILIERVVSANNAYAGQTGNTDGFAVEGMCTNLVIRDCVSYGAGDSGFDLKPSDVLIERVLSYNNAGMGIKLWGNNVKVVNAIVYGNKIDGIATAGTGLQFYNCTIANNASNGIRLETTSPSTVTLRNNIIYNNPVQTYGSTLWNDDYNHYYSTSGDYVIRTAGATYTHSQVASHTAPVGSHSSGGDPVFVGPSSANFRLSSTSPCIGTGVASSLATVDYYGTTRNNPPDKGAIAASGTTAVIPTAPTGVSITPSGSTGVDTDLTALATGSTASNGSTATYQYQWAKSTDGGTTWGAWGNTGATLAKSNLADGQVWKAHARATVDNANYSAWTESATVTITTGTASAVAAPSQVAITPGSPTDNDNLSASANGGGVTGKSPSYTFQWSKSASGSTSWSAWGSAGSVYTASNTAAGDRVKARACVVDGTSTSAWTESAVVTIASGTTTTTPVRPTSVVVTPGAPTDTQNLVATASPAAPAGITYIYQWRKMDAGSKKWSSWGWTGQTLSASVTSPGQKWQARVRATDGTTLTSGRASNAVTIQAATSTTQVGPGAPTVTVSPTAPTDDSTLTGYATATDANGDTLEYEFYWARSTDGGRTWGGWNYYGKTLSASQTSVGDCWKVQSRAHDGQVWGPFAQSAAVTIR